MSVDVGQVLQAHSQAAYATLVRLLKDFDIASDAHQEACAAALDQWPESGIPDNPRAWLVSAGRNHAYDYFRRKTRYAELQPEIERRWQRIQDQNQEGSTHEIQDDRLRLIFACCHPAIDRSVQIPLTLKEVCGLSTDQIAHGFLVSKDAMAQRIVRGKAKIRDAGIPIEIPGEENLAERLQEVLLVIYLIFNEGYSASTGDTLTRPDLSAEAIRLGRLLLELIPDPEVKGLLGLMLLHESRRQARTDAEGEIILLEDQDRSLWDQNLITEGQSLIEDSFRSRQVGPYTIQAAISAVHAVAPTASETDWPQIVALYDMLLSTIQSPVVELNRAVAIAMRDGPEAGLKLIENLFERKELLNYALAFSAQGELLLRLGKLEQSQTAFRAAREKSNQASEQRFLDRKLAQIESLIASSAKN